jgi:hypothetical protein
MEAPAASNRQAQDRAREAGRDLRDRPAGGLDARPGQGGAGAQASRDRAREVAQSRTQHPQAGQHRDGSRAKQAGPGTARANTQAREQARTQHQQRSQVHTPRPQGAQVQRQHDRPQPRAAHDASRNNAFAGASHPQQARAQSNRGQASRQMSQRPQSARASGGHQVQRAQHGGGGARRRG